MQTTNYIFYNDSTGQLSIQFVFDYCHFLNVTYPHNPECRYFNYMSVLFVAFPPDIGAYANESKMTYTISLKNDGINVCFSPAFQVDSVYDWIRLYVSIKSGRIILL